jgi:hypothetical protein
MYSNKVRRTVKDGLHTNLYTCVAGLYMYSNEVRRTVKDGLHMASLGSGDLETRLGIKHPLHRKAGIQYLSNRSLVVFTTTFFDFKGFRLLRGVFFNAESFFCVTHRELRPHYFYCVVSFIIIIIIIIIINSLIFYSFHRHPIPQTFTYLMTACQREPMRDVGHVFFVLTL